jgi:hypothetical protein
VTNTVQLAVVAGVIVLASVDSWLLERVRGPTRRLAIRSARLRVARRHLESLDAWDRRTDAAEQALTEAAVAFEEEARRLDRVEQVGHTGLRCSLPGSHPLAVALVAARYPDGPSHAELLQLAGGNVVEVGVDATRVVPS